MIVRAGVADAGLSRIEGYPQLRADRFLASFAFDRPVGGTYRFWLETMEKRGNEARRREMQNLSTGELGQIRKLFSSGSEPAAIIETCARQLTREDMNSPHRRSELLNRVRVPDSYDEASRVLGLYALTKIPFLEGVADLHGELRTSFAKAPGKPPTESRIIRYSPPAGVPIARKQIAAILETAAQNPLRMPILAPDELSHLFDAFAPVWEIETGDDNDRIGALHWGGDGKAKVDITSPMVYRLASHTRYGDTRPASTQLSDLVSRPRARRRNGHLRRRIGWHHLAGHPSVQRRTPGLRQHPSLRLLLPDIPRSRRSCRPAHGRQ